MEEKGKKTVTIKVEIDGVPVVEERALIDSTSTREDPHDPQPTKGVLPLICIVLFIFAAAVVGYFCGEMDGKKQGKDVYAAQLKEAAIDAAENFAVMAEECGWVADIEEGVEIDDYDGTFVDVRIEKYFERETLRYDADICVYPGLTTYEVNGEPYSIDEWREALTQYGEGRDYDGTMPEPKMIQEIQEPTPEPPHKNPVAKPEFQQPAP